MPKFTIETHEKRMRDLLKPKPQVAGSELLNKFREIAKKRKAGTGAEMKPVTEQEQ